MILVDFRHQKWKICLTYIGWELWYKPRYSSKVRTFWEAHMIWKNLPHGFDVDQLICQNHEEDFFKFCVFLRKSELYEGTYTVNPFKTIIRRLWVKPFCYSYVVIWFKYWIVFSLVETCGWNIFFFMEHRDKWTFIYFSQYLRKMNLNYSNF